MIYTRVRILPSSTSPHRHPTVLIPGMRILSLLWLKTQVPTALTTNSSHVCFCALQLRQEAASPVSLSGSDLQQCLVYPYLLLTCTQCPCCLAYSSRSQILTLVPSRIACLSQTVTQSGRYAGSGVGVVIPGAARLISETAQKVHTIGQKHKNDQHLQRVQALLSGRQAKGLTSGSHPTSL